MKKCFSFISIIIIFFIILLLFVNNTYNKENNKKNVIKSKLGVVIKIDKNNFLFRELSNKYKIYKIKKIIPNLKVNDVIKIKYINNNINLIDDYSIYKNYIVKNSYTLYSYMKQKNKNYIIKTKKEYERFILKNNIINSKKYNEQFFKNKNLYINIMNYNNECSQTDIINTYLFNNTIIMEINNNNNKSCDKKNITKYFIVETKKNIKKSKLYINKNRLNYYNSYNSNKTINLYVWKKNKNLVYGLINDKDLNKGLINISFMKALPLTLNEVTIIIKNKYTNTSLRIIGEVDLSKKQIDLIKCKIGDEY